MVATTLIRVIIEVIITNNKVVITEDMVVVVAVAAAEDMKRDIVKETMTIGQVVSLTEQIIEIGIRIRITDSSIDLRDHTGIAMCQHNKQM